ncbi:MAG: hypothetical protein EBU90_20445 [Proteobacteria bacterium]|nr:hypothetical protein [Pseudomonadota bacterium]
MNRNDIQLINEAYVFSNHVTDVLTFEFRHEVDSMFGDHLLLKEGNLVDPKTINVTMLYHHENKYIGHFWDAYSLSKLKQQVAASSCYKQINPITWYDRVVNLLKTRSKFSPVEIKKVLDILETQVKPKLDPDWTWAGCFSNMTGTGLHEYLLVGMTDKNRVRAHKELEQDLNDEDDILGVKRIFKEL